MDPRYRKIAGLVLGTAIGLVFGILTQTANPLMLPGVPLYQPPFGPWVNAALSVLAGALLGLLTGWTFSSIEGILIGTVAGTILMQLALLLSGKSAITITSQKLIAVLVLFLPIGGGMLIVLGGLRWSIDRLVEYHIDKVHWARRGIMLAVLLALIVWVASWTFYQPEALTVLSRMNALVLAAQQAAGSLPEELNSIDSGRIRNIAGIPYLLEYDTQDLNRFGIARLAPGTPQESAAIARYENGARLVCIYATPDKFPDCALFDRLP